MLNPAKQIPVLGPHIEEQPLSMREDWEKLTTIEFQKTDICQGDLLDNDNTYGIKINGIQSLFYFAYFPRKLFGHLR